MAAPNGNASLGQNGHQNGYQLPVTRRGMMGADGTSDEEISKGLLSVKGLIVEGRLLRSYYT